MSDVAASFSLRKRRINPAATKLVYVFQGFILMKKKGLIIVISAPSGAGKTTLCDELIKRSNNIVRSISYTTRKKRPGEKNGRDYFFVSKNKFQNMIKSDKFVEWARVYGYYYGTSKDYLDKTINFGKHVLLNIDVQGGLNIKGTYPQSILIFVMPPSMKELENRLKSRKQDIPKEIKKRLKNAKKEIKYKKFYDYTVVNDKIKKAYKEIKSIIKNKKRRVS